MRGQDPKMRRHMPWKGIANNMNTRYLDMLQKNSMTLIMSLPANDPELARAAWEYGADVVKVHINVDHHASKTHFGSFEEEKEALLQILQEAKGPCGLVAGGNLEKARQDYRAAAEAGFEFVSLYAKHTPLEILESGLMLNMIALDSEYTTDEVRALDKIGAHVLEASVMQPDTYGQPLSAKELMEYYTICSNTELPVVIPTQRAVLPEETAALQRCGAKAVMIGAVVTGKTKDSIARSVSAFREAIDQLQVSL